MGCTWVSVSCLPVLIIASFAANMKATTDTVSTIGNAKMSSIEITTTEPNADVTNSHRMNTHRTETNITKNNNNPLLENSNCIYEVDQGNCTTSSGVTFVMNVTKTIVTYRDFKEYRYYRNVIEIMPYAANIPGIITNSLTLVVAANIKPLHTSETYMIALGSADFITVLTRSIYLTWLIKTDKMNEVGCKLPRYVVHVALIFSNMTLMAWTIERFIAVVFPLKLASWCSMRNTRITLLMLLILCMLLAIPFLTEFDMYEFLSGEKFVSTCIESIFFNTIWAHVESFYYIYIPMFCLCICNTAILCRLNAMTKSRIAMSSNQETIDKKTSENRRMTILLLTISGSFIILHIPQAIFYVFSYFYPDVSILISENPHFFARYLLYSTIGLLITEYQNCVNFFLYCISGNKFRATFMRIFCKPLMKNKRTQATESSVTRTTKI